MKKTFLLILILLVVPTKVMAETKEVTLDSCVQADQIKFKDKEGFVTTYQLHSIVSPSVNHITKGEEPYSKEARDYVCEKLTNASSIKIEEVETTITDHGEAYVFVNEVLLQEELLNLGYAKISFLDENNPYYEVLAQAESTAKENKIGIWKEEEKTTEEKIEETIKEEKEILSSTKKDSNNKKNTNPVMKIINEVLDSLVAGINKMIDSILQKIDNML